MCLNGCEKENPWRWRQVNNIHNAVVSGIIKENISNSTSDNMIAHWLLKQYRDLHLACLFSKTKLQNFQYSCCTCQAMYHTLFLWCQYLYWYNINSIAISDLQCTGTCLDRTMSMPSHVLFVITTNWIPSPLIQRAPFGAAPLPSLVEHQQTPGQSWSHPLLPAPACEMP